MKVSIKWLEQYFNKNLDSKKIEKELTKLGLEVEDRKYLGDGIKKVVVGRIEKIEKHPDADKLQICRINVGDEELLQIITAAKNVYEGMVVPVALVGAEVIGGSIKLSKLRGIESYGMLCSAEELGIENALLSEEEKDGILPLSVDMKLGTSILEALNLDDSVLELGLTPNRADCYGIYNVAKEVAIGEDEELKEIELLKANGISKDKTIKIVKEDLCHRYTSRIVRDVKIESSPIWFANLLRNVGIRPINNLVDITNYVMFEIGQPMHAFDLDKLEGNEILVDTAKKDEKFITLDGQERTLDEDTLVIKDSKKIVALAGVMGGENSEVDSSTRRILLEAANFNSASVRKTSRKLGLRSEASSRFERGLSEESTLKAMERACYLIEAFKAGKVDDNFQEDYPVKQVIPTITCTSSYINRVLGMDISEEEILGIFKKLGFKVSLDEYAIKVTPKPYRIDIKDKIDLVEEVVRVYGYDKIPSTLPTGATNTLREEAGVELKEKVKNQMVSEGLMEAITYSFIDNRSYEEVGLDYEGDSRLEIVNPISEKQKYMRESLLPGLIEVASRNYKRQRKDIRIFEVGNVFKGTSDNLPDEDLTLAVLLAENKVKEYYGVRENDFYVIKGILERLLKKISREDFNLEVIDDKKTFHPGRSGKIIISGMKVGEIGELHPEIVDRYDIREKVYYMEINLKLLVNKDRTIYSQIPKYPFVERDMAFTIPKDISYEKIISVIDEASDKKVIKSRLFDVYEGSQIEEGYKSMAFSITYQDKDKTLTDEEVTLLHDKILEALSKKAGAILRK